MRTYATVASAGALLLGSALAGLVPGGDMGLAHRNAAAITATKSITSVSGNATSVAITTTTIACVQEFCQGVSSMCIYWAGVTGWDPSEGVVPGMTAVPFAPCFAVTPTTASDSALDTIDTPVAITPGSAAGPDTGSAHAPTSRPTTPAVPPAAL